MSKIIVIIGQPGAGKGTQSRLISEKYSYPQISTGDLLRGIAKTDTPLGNELKSIMDTGNLVSDGILAEVLLARTTEEDCRNGYVLDGYPRTVSQAHMLEVLAEQQKKSVLLLNIRVDEGMLMKRITGRLTCASCGEIYNTYCFPPKVEGICDIDGGELLRRGDDRPEAVTLRMAAYRAKTEPLIDYYNQSSRLIDVDGGQPVDRVFMKICQALEGQQVSDGS
ncbi:MAG: adenylate kinase [Blastocatellia bacterium]